jgi:hypothetical protein
MRSTSDDRTNPNRRASIVSYGAGDCFNPVLSGDDLLPSRTRSAGGRKLTSYVFRMRAALIGFPRRNALHASHPSDTRLRPGSFRDGKALQGLRSPGQGQEASRGQGEVPRHAREGRTGESREGRHRSRSAIESKEGNLAMQLFSRRPIPRDATPGGERERCCTSLGCR